MFTEQEVIAQLNDKIAREGVKSTTQKFLDKVKTLQSRLNNQMAELKKIQEAEEQANLEIQRIRGAISMLLELAAEEEEMLDEAEIPGSQ